MNRCEEIQPLLYPWLDDELGTERAALVAAHLEECPACKRRAAAERRFLERVAEAGSETAPAGLRARIEKIVAGGEGSQDNGQAVSPLRRRWRWVVPAIAAAAVMLLVLRPWGDATQPARAASFAEDSDSHAATDPSVSPFPEGARVPEPPDLPGARLAGLSECVLDEVSYAHYTFRIGERLVSVFLPVGGVALPRLDAAGEGGTSVVPVEAGGGRPAAVLVSADMEPAELRALWAGN